MSLLKIISVLGILIAYQTLGVTSYKFLAIAPTAAQSHYIVASALFKGLVEKGHEVTVISPLTLKKPINNYHEIPIPKIIEMMTERTGSIMQMLTLKIHEKLKFIHDMGLQLTEFVLTDDGVQQLLRSNQTFDAVICEVFLTEALYGFSQHFNAPLIAFSTFGAATWNTEMVGSPSPPSYVPHLFLPLTDHMSFLQRLGNLALFSFEKVFLETYFNPRQLKLYQEHFPNAKQSLYDVRRNTALVLLNTHVSLGFPRPYVPNHIEVGGLHIDRKIKPLPDNIRKFIEGAEHGVIYFSMGSNLKSKMLPLEKRQILLNTFRSLKQRVLWKFEDTTLEGKPENVLISDWFPQNDILAHDNVKLFITHGGLLSTTETIFHGTPIVGIPMFGDQFLNMARAELNGFGIKVDYQTISIDIFKGAIQRILDNPSYTKQIRALSSRFRDQPDLPLDRAVYWVEHIVRHGGAKYLHCAGQDLSFIQYHSIDTIITLYGGILLILYLFLRFIKYLLSKLFARTPTKKSKKVKKN